MRQQDITYSFGDGVVAKLRPLRHPLVQPPHSHHTGQLAILHHA